MSWEHGDSNIPDWLAEAGLLEKYISYDEHPEGVSEIKATRSIVPHEVALEKHRLAWDARSKRILGGMSREESDEIMSRQAESWRPVVWFKKRQSWAKLKREAHEFTKQLVREGKTEVPKRSPKLGDVVQLTEEASWAASWRNVRVFGGLWEVEGKDSPAIEALKEVRGIIVAKRKKEYVVVWDERGFEQLVKRYAKKGRKDRVRGYLGYLPWEVARSGLKVVSDRRGAYRQKTRAPEKTGQYDRKTRPPAPKPETPKLAPKLQRAVELLAGGHTIKEVAKELGVYDSQVRKWVSHPDFESNMKAQGMKYSSKTGWKAKSNGGSRILYHIGKRPAQPKPKRAGWRDVGQDDSDWVRPWLDSPVPKGVFLSSNPVLVAINHGVYGHVYAYEVPQWVIKKAGGIHRYDDASEILIPDTLWKHVKFLGKSLEKNKLYEKVEQYTNAAYRSRVIEELGRDVRRRESKKNPRKGKRYKSPPHPRGMAENEVRKARYHDIKYMGKRDEGEGPLQVFQAREDRDNQLYLIGVGRQVVTDRYGRSYGDAVKVKVLGKLKPKGPEQLKLFKNPRSGRQKLIVAAREVCTQNDTLNCRLFTQLVTGTPKLESLPKVKQPRVGDVLQFGSSPARHWALYLGKNEVVEVPEWGEPARIRSVAALVEEWDKPTYIRRPASQVEAKSMRKNPKGIKSISLPLSVGEGVTDHPRKWREGLVKFQRLVEGLGKDLPTGVWVVAMGFPPFETLDTLGRGGQRGTVKPPLGQYKHSWAALYKNKYNVVWVVEAINYTGYPAGGEASLYPLRLLKDWDDHEILPNSPKLWEHLAQATCAYGMETPFQIAEGEDMVESVKPTLAWADKIIDTPWKTPIFSAVSSPQSRLVWEFDQAKKAAKKNPRGSDIYDPREEQLRAQRQAIYESSLLRDEPQLRFKSFRNAKGERLDQHIIEEDELPWLREYIGQKMFRIGVGVQKRDQRLKRKDGYLSLTAKTISESKKRYSDVDKLVRNRQDYEESLALMRKSTFYRVTPEPTREGLKYFVWPMQPGQRLPKGFTSKKRAENVANLANRDAPTVGGAWWKPPKKKYTKRELADWLPPADIWRSK
jgi:DNA-binding NarL/FixJ family response regulator